MKIICVPLDGVEYSAVAGYARLLPKKRQEKIERFKYESDKLRSLAAGLLIRRAVGDAELIENEHGKPYAEGNVFFSVSHSASYAAIAVDSEEIGLDIEKLPDKDYMKIAERFYHPEELGFVKGSADSARAFTRVWTRKEAYLKQSGVGISQELRGFDTTSGEISDRIVSVDFGEYVISACSNRNITEKDAEISILELKELL